MLQGEKFCHLELRDNHCYLLSDSNPWSNSLQPNQHHCRYSEQRTVDTNQCYHVHQLRLSAGKFNKRLFEFDFFPPIQIIWKYPLKFWIWILASGGCYQCEFMVCGFWGTVFFAGWVFQYRHWVYYQLDSHGLHYETQQQLVRIDQIHSNPSIVHFSVA